MKIKYAGILATCMLWTTNSLSTSAQDTATTAGKRLDIVLLGDSNTWIGGDSCDQPRGWNKWMKDQLKPNTCTSYARSGATWTNTPQTTTNTTEYTELLSDNNVIYNQIKRLEMAVDSGRQPQPNLIVVAAGTNDAWFSKKRPKALDLPAEDAFSSADSTLLARNVNEVLTLAEAVRYGCTMLKKRFPDAQLVLLTPLQSTAISTTAIHKAGDIIESCGKRMDIGTIRQDYNCIDSAHEKIKKKLTTDGTHTSVAGAQHNANYITPQLKQLINTTK